MQIEIDAFYSLTRGIWDEGVAYAAGSVK